LTNDPEQAKTAEKKRGIPGRFWSFQPENSRLQLRPHTALKIADRIVGIGFLIGNALQGVMDARPLGLLIAKDTRPA